MDLPGNAGEERDSGYARLEQQIRWYDTSSMKAQNRYKTTKIWEFVVGAAIPVLAMTAPGWVTASAGAVALGLEGVQQICQWHHNWITYRSTCESLRHEKYSYLARSGEYDGLDEGRAHKLLVERVEGFVSTEHSKWVTTHQREARRKSPVENASQA